MMCINFRDAPITIFLANSFFSFFFLQFVLPVPILQIRFFFLRTKTHSLKKKITFFLMENIILW